MAKKAVDLEEINMHNRFIKPEVDPGINHVVQTTAKLSVDAIYRNCYLSKSTIRKIKTGVTRRPQHMTMTALYRAAGFELVAVKRKSK